MARYRVYLQTVASTTVEVDANSPETAYDAALGANMPRICAQCAGWGRGKDEPALELNDEWDISQDLGLEQSVEKIA